jgi:hypothetical protein
MSASATGQLDPALNRAISDAMVELYATFYQHDRNDLHQTTSSSAHLEMTTKATYMKRLKEHRSETERHGREVKQRIKQLGGTAETVSAPGPEPIAEAAQERNSPRPTSRPSITTTSSTTPPNHRKRPATRPPLRTI